MGSSRGGESGTGANCLLAGLYARVVVSRMRVFNASDRRPTVERLEDGVHRHAWVYLRRGVIYDCRTRSSTCVRCEGMYFMYNFSVEKRKGIQRLVQFTARERYLNSYALKAWGGCTSCKI